MAIGLGAGTSSVVARAIGAGDHRRARRLATDSLLLSFMVTAVLAAIGILTINPLFKLLGAPADMIPMIRSFMTILYSGVPFLVVGMVGTSSMRATGDTVLPGKLMMAGALLNVILDPIFIFGIGPVPAKLVGVENHLSLYQHLFSSGLIVGLTALQLVGSRLIVGIQRIIVIANVTLLSLFILRCIVWCATNAASAVKSS